MGAIVYVAKPPENMSFVSKYIPNTAVMNIKITLDSATLYRIFLARNLSTQTYKSFTNYTTFSI